MKKKENPERRNEVEKTLLELSSLEQKVLFEKYQTDEEGLDPVQASDRLEEYGKNIIDFSGKDDGNGHLRLQKPCRTNERIRISADPI